jgi:hypothetical protein
VDNAAGGAWVHMAMWELELAIAPVVCVRREGRLRMHACGRVGAVRVRLFR